jgi:hypothetical protein
LSTLIFLSTIILVILMLLACVPYSDPVCISKPDVFNSLLDPIHSLCHFSVRLRSRI